MQLLNFAKKKFWIRVKEIQKWRRILMINSNHVRKAKKLNVNHDNLIIFFFIWKKKRIAFERMTSNKCRKCISIQWKSILLNNPCLSSIFVNWTILTRLFRQIYFISFAGNFFSFHFFLFRMMFFVEFKGKKKSISI